MTVEISAADLEQVKDPVIFLYATALRAALETVAERYGDQGLEQFYKNATAGMEKVPAPLNDRLELFRRLLQYDIDQVRQTFGK